jgi:hypothetical protein
MNQVLKNTLWANADKQKNQKTEFSIPDSLFKISIFQFGL